MITLLLAALLAQDKSFTDKPDLDTALAKAAKENRRVLVVWGSNDDEPSKAFAALLKKDRTVSKKLLYEYDVVLSVADVDLMKKLEVDITKLPSLTILAADRKKLTHEEAPAEAKPLVALLEKHQATPWNAKELYDAALKRARDEKKRVFLTFGAPW